MLKKTTVRSSPDRVGDPARKQGGNVAESHPEHDKHVRGRLGHVLAEEGELSEREESERRALEEEGDLRRGREESERRALKEV